MKVKVALVDSGGTNIGSVRSALRRFGVDAMAGSDSATLRSASHVIMPGVGAAEPGMCRLQAHGLVDTVRSLQQPVLGICLGMQLLFEHSEEADTDCLGIVQGCVRKMKSDGGVRVPHIGWNTLSHTRDNALFTGEDVGAHAYFVHSFAAPISIATIATTEHGEQFSAAIQHENFFGVQFHPERSSDLGARVMRRFLAL